MNKDYCIKRCKDVLEGKDIYLPNIPVINVKTDKERIEYWSNAPFELCLICIVHDTGWAWCLYKEDRWFGPKIWAKIKKLKKDTSTIEYLR